MFVWDQKTNAYEDKKLSGTTMSYWDDCGLIVDTFEEFIDKFPVFLKNLNKLSTCFANQR